MSQAYPDPFWLTKRLDEMSHAEWESLCDGCGLCCLHKLRDEESGELAFTKVACRLLDTETCRCRDYANRFSEVPDCTALTPDVVAAVDWLPPSCAYRLVEERKNLPDWHPLITGDPDSPHRAGITAARRVISEGDADDLEDHIVAWPGRWPQRRTS